MILKNPFGTIEYKGKGVFIAGGTGITPFIATLRKLKLENNISGHKLFFSNKTRKDILLEKELLNIFDSPKGDILLTLTREEENGYKHGRINKEFLENNLDSFNHNFYVCGPTPFTADITSALENLGAKSESLIIEK